MWKTKLTSDKQYLCCFLSSQNVKRTHADQSILHYFVLFQKRNDSWYIFKSSSNNEPFYSAYVIGVTCFNECFLFYVILEDTIFYKGLSLLWGLFQPPWCCVLWKNSFERSPYFQLSPHNSMMLIPNFRNKFYNRKVSLTNFIFDYVLSVITLYFSF